MKRILLFVLCASLTLSGFAQQKKSAKGQGNKPKKAQTKSAAKAAETIQWAGGVEEFSSQLTEKSNAAERIVGTPNAMPQGGSHPDAWEPLEGKNEFITVRFDTPIQVSQVVILENYMPGAVTHVIAFDSSGAPHTIASYTAAPPSDKSRVLVIQIPKTRFSVHRLRIEVNTTLTSENPQFDAVGISTTHLPVKLINLPSDEKEAATPERLSDEINSSSIEVGPVISTDGKTLYFSRAGHPGNVGGKKDVEDIWVSKATPDGGWQAPENIGTPLNNEGANFIASVMPDANTILVGNEYVSKGEMKSGASLAYRQEDGTFATPVNIEIVNDQNFNKFVDYMLSSTGNVLIISEEREKSIGARDLYVSFLQDDGRWSEPKTLGTVINTASDEFAPFLAADDRSLYFSTAGRPGYGGADIFLSRRIGNGWDTWTEPQNLGSSINGPGKDAYFTLPASGTYAYFTSAGQNKDETDIYRVNLSKSQRPKPVVLVSGKVVDSKTKKPIEADIVYEDLSTGKKVGTARSNPKTGNYQIALPGGQNYGYVAKPKNDGNAFGVSSNLNLRELKEYKEVKQDLIVADQEVGAVVRMNNLFFDFNKAVLKKESYPELSRMVAYLKKYPKLTLEIAGHTDSVGTDSFNKKLSGSRSKSVVQYLTGKGISSKRLRVKAYGSTSPLQSNRTEEGRATNRRVEFVVLQKGTE